MKRVKVLLALLMALGAVLALGSTFASAQSVDESAALDQEGNTLVDVIIRAANANPAQFTLLLAAVQAADPAVLETLNDPSQRLTVFAPADRAFTSLPDGVLDALLNDTELLTQILLYHVLPIRAASSDVLALLEQNSGAFIVNTLLDEPVTVLQTEDFIFVNDAFLRVEGGLDIFASNGVIHIIDGILIPPSLEEAIGEVIASFAGAEEVEVEEEVSSAEVIGGAVDRLLGAGSGDSDLPTIAEIAVGSEDFETLVLLLTGAAPDFVEALSDPAGEFTVFAPTDEAFDALASLLGINIEDALLFPDLVRAILAYHVVPAVAPAEVVVTLDGEEVVTLGGEAVLVSIVDGGVVLNDTVNVIATDVFASNGVIHVIDGVLVPPSAIETLIEFGLLPAPEEAEEVEEEVEEGPSSAEVISGAVGRLLGAGSGDSADGDLPTIAEIAVGSEDFETLVLILTAAATDYLEALSDPAGDFTVFAPTDDAFDALGAALGIEISAAIAFPDILIDILGYHVLEGAVPAEVVVTLDGVEVETIQGESITISIVDGGVVLNGTVNVIVTDVFASNGVIHVIDAVLLPQSTIETLAGLGLSLP